MYSTPGESPPLYTLPAAIGATTLAILPRVLSVPLALPRYVAGNASGVYAYRSAQKSDWNQYASAFRAMLAVSELTF